MLWWELNGLQLNKEQTMGFPVCFPLGLDKGLCYPQPAAKQFLYVLYSYFEVLCCPAGVGEGKGFRNYSFLSHLPLWSTCFSFSSDFRNKWPRQRSGTDASEWLWVNTKIRWWIQRLDGEWKWDSSDQPFALKWLSGLWLKEISNYPNYR